MSESSPLFDAIRESAMEPGLVCFGVRLRDAIDAAEAAYLGLGTLYEGKRQTVAYLVNDRNALRARVADLEENLANVCELVPTSTEYERKQLREALGDE